MSQSEVENMILRELYKVWFTPRRMELVNKLKDALGSENGSSFERVLGELSQRKLIRWVTNDSCEITPDGILHAERNNIPADELKSHNQRARDLILDRLARAYDENGTSGYADYQSMMTDFGLEMYLVINTLQFLNERGYTESYYYAGTSRITQRGLDYANQWRKRRSLVEEFSLLSLWEPIPRGRGFQKWFARLVESQGWTQEEGVKTKSEEMDVIINIGRDYYMIECKWERDPIEAGAIRELHGKLAKRAGMNGIVVSMSGFTSGAEKEVVDFAHSELILLFGPGDVQSIIDGKVTFAELLNTKYEALIKRGKVEHN